MSARVITFTGGKERPPRSTLRRRSRFDRITKQHTAATMPADDGITAEYRYIVASLPRLAAQCPTAITALRQLIDKTTRGVR